jgi:hypothetical protein
MAANLGFIYIKLNAEYTYYFKGGYTDCPERRLHDGTSEHLEKSRFETIYEIIKNESGEECVDRIIFEFAEIENLSQYPNIQITDINDTSIELPMEKSKISELNKDLVQAGIGIFSIEAKRKLEDYFIKMVNA